MRIGIGMEILIKSCVNELSVYQYFVTVVRFFSIVNSIDDSRLFRYHDIFRVFMLLDDESAVHIS